LTKKDLAEIFNISRPTLNKWEKEKPELVRLVNQGLLIDELIDESEKNLKNLKTLKEKVDNNKFNIK
jgi:transcriptional regulator with XRE-family HTH domain